MKRVKEDVDIWDGFRDTRTPEEKAAQEKKRAAYRCRFCGEHDCDGECQE